MHCSSNDKQKNIQSRACFKTKRVVWYGVKIKPTPKKKARNPHAYHWWLIDEKPRTKGRLAQLTKWNQKLRRLNPVSEFITMVKRLDETLPSLLPATTR